MTSGVNLVQADRAPKTPRLIGEAASQKAKIRKAGRIASFVFELDTYCVNGYAAHAKASVAPSCAPPKRRPTSPSPRMQSRSKRIAVACAVGSRSHLPLQPKTRYAGMYDSYETGPYVSACGFADSQRPFVWMRLRISPFASAGPHGFRLSSTGKWLYGALPSWTIRSAPIGPA